MSTSSEAAACTLAALKLNDDELPITARKICEKKNPYDSFDIFPWKKKAHLTPEEKKELADDPMIDFTRVPSELIPQRPFKKITSLGDAEESFYNVRDFTFACDSDDDNDEDKARIKRRKRRERFMAIYNRRAQMKHKPKQPWCCDPNNEARGIKGCLLEDNHHAQEYMSDGSYKEKLSCIHCGKDLQHFSWRCPPKFPMWCDGQ